MKGYAIVQGISVHDLVRLVNAMLREGYLLAGGVSSDTAQGVTVFYQALYKTEVKA